MPRPKRTKVASVAPTRFAKPARTAAPAPRHQKATNASNNTDSFSSDSDGLIVKSTRPQRRMPWQPARQKDVDLTMTGALPVNDEEEGRSETQRKPRSRRGNIQPGDHHTPTSDASRKLQQRMNTSKAPVKDSPPVASDPEITTAPSAPVEDEETSLLDPSLLSFGSLDSDSPAHGTRPPSAMKIGGTPAHETSILALTNFRRRARQPSLLRMVHQTTDIEDNDLDLDDLHDFHPDVESTPLHLQKSGAVEAANENSGLSLSSTSSRGKKRKQSSPVVQVPCSSPPYDPPSGDDVEISQRSSSPSLPEAVVESQEIVETQELIEPGDLSETMAPPRSSSAPVDEIEDSPVKPRQQRRRGRTRQTTRGSDSEGSATDRPTKPRAKQKPKPKEQTISTKKLQSLLPRRRTRVPQEHDEYDIEGSEEVDLTPVDSDQDELQMPSRRHVPTKKPAPSKTSKKPSRAAKKSAMSPATSRKNKRTYGRRTSSDKENESTFVANEDSVDADEPTEPSIELPTSKLAAIAKKFEDVDAFEMDFESVDVSGGNSSPWR